jgi:hypothetical protein
LSRKSRALGIPEGVFKTCPAGRHVIETSASYCIYCQEEEGRGLAEEGRNPINALDQLRDQALSNSNRQEYPPDHFRERSGAESISSPRSDGGPDGLMSTQVRAGDDSFRKMPIPTPPQPQPPGPTGPATEVVAIGPDRSAATSPGPASTPFGVPDEMDHNSNKTMPLQAAVRGDIKTHVMVSAGATNPVLGWIRGLNGPIKGRSFDICHGRNILGSDASCSVVISSPDIRPRHVSIMANEDGITATLTDVESTLKVNGTLTQSLHLVDGDLLELGPAAFRFRCLSATDLSPAPRKGSNS